MMDHTIGIELKENPLTTDRMEVCLDGYGYGVRGGARVKVVFYTYANEWGDNENVFYARTVESAIKKYEKMKGELTEEERELVDTVIACEPELEWVRK